MMSSAFGEVDSKTPFVSVKPDNFQGSPISNLFMHQLPHSVSLGTVLHFSLIPWSPYLHNKPLLDQVIYFQNGCSKTQEEKPAVQNLLMEIQRCVFQSSLKDSTVLTGNQECSQETSRYTSRELFLLLNGQLKPLLFCHISMSLKSQ